MDNLFHNDDHTQQSQPVPTISTPPKKRDYFSWIAPINYGLDRIKHIPWFSVLLALLLGYGAYQIIRYPNVPSHAWFQQLVKKASSTMRQSLRTQLYHKRNHVIKTVVDKESNENHRIQKVAPSEDFSSAQWVAYNQRLENLEKREAKVQSEIVLLKQEFDRVKDQWQDIQQTVLNNATAIAQNETLASGKSEAQHPSVIENPTVQYSVHAAIQGRAWLNAEDGRIVTVNIGSILSPFGVVQQIDVENRLVYFASGHVIGPPSDDA